jgi:hypothetical protein
MTGINPNLTIVKFQTFDEQIAGQFTEERMIARLTALFGALAPLLAVVGLYGVTDFAVARRTSEIGIRMALDANHTRVIAMVMRGALIHIGIGLAIGIAAALLSVRFVESQLYEIKGTDAGILLTAIFTLTAAALHRRHDSRAPRRLHRSRPRATNGVTRRPWPLCHVLAALADVCWEVTAAQSARVRDNGEFQQGPSYPPYGKPG